MSLRVTHKTVVNEDTFNDGVQVRHVGWTIFWVLGLLLILGVGGGFIVQGTDFILYKTFAPKYEGVRRQVFEQTKSYNQGMAQTVTQYQMQYTTASDEHKDALRASILHTTADYDADKLPPHLALWLRQLRSEATGR